MNRWTEQSPLPVHEREKKKIAVQGEKIKVVQGFAAMDAEVLSKRSDVIKNISVR
jgi:hypothetical protein